MLSSTLTIMERNSLTVDTVDWLVPHQANLRIIEAVASRAKMPMEKVLVNIEKRGNTSAASIPICLDENTDRLKAGDRVVTEGAYQVRLASASNAIPAHSHEH